MPDGDVCGRDAAIAAIEDDARWFVSHLGELERCGVHRHGLWGIWDRLDAVCVPDGDDCEYVEWYVPRCGCVMDAADVVETLHDTDPSTLDCAVRDLFDGWPGQAEPDGIGDAYAYLMAMDDESRDQDGRSDRDRAMERVAELVGSWDDYEERHVHEVWGVRPDNLFLTREDAEAHLASNWYHYAEGARPVCIRPWRSPRITHLMDALCALGGAPYEPGYKQPTLPGMEGLDV